MKRLRHCDVIGSERERLRAVKNITWSIASQKHFDENMNTPSTVATYLANRCVRKVMQIKLIWCMEGIKRAVFEASVETKLGEQQWKL